MNNVYLNSIATAVPEFDIHEKFTNYAEDSLDDEYSRALLKILVKRSQIEHRYSVLKSSVKSNLLDENNIYADDEFPSTKERMLLYEQNAFPLACKALDQLDLARHKEDITHLIITTCTGFYAPGIDLQIIEHYGLKLSTKRTIIGFMGCYAAINALKMARYIISSDKSANVLIVNIELCTLHLQATDNVQDLLPFLIFADGCAASIVSAKKTGLELQSFYSTILPNSSDQIMWHIGDSGFDMVLSSLVSKLIIAELPKVINEIWQGKKREDFAHFAIHPGGKSIIDAVEKGIGLHAELLKPSREVLRQFGNMSSAAIMFVLKEIMQKKNSPGEGCAIAFGPGVAVESMLFKKL